MKIAYLILAYNNPNHLRRLIKGLFSPNSHFYIHVDQKSNMNDFGLVSSKQIEILEERIPVYWGDISAINAILVMMKKALSITDSCDYLFLLSGSDYPLQSTAYIEKYLQNNIGKEFMNLVQIPNDEAGKPLSRFTAYKFTPHTPYFIILFYKVLVKLGVIARQRDYKKYLDNLQPYGGSTWWCLSRESCVYILDFLENHPRFVRYFQNTFIPEEMFFHTILGNSIYKDKIQGNLVFTDWSSKGPHPAVLGDHHLNIFNKEPQITINDVYGKREVLFARKFTDASTELVEKIDQMRLEKERLRTHNGE